MVIPVSKIEYQAAWNAANMHLKDPISTLNQKIEFVVWNIFSILIPIIGLARLMGYAVGCIANRIILPAVWCISQQEISERDQAIDQFWQGPITGENRSARKHFQLVKVELTTPDGVTLDVKWLRHNNRNRDSPTLIHFSPNGTLAMRDPSPWFLQKAIEKNMPCSFVFFDYRGVGHSTGTFNAAKDLVVDGSSVVQWVGDYLGTPRESTYFYGRSLGGAMAAQTQALDDRLTGPHLNVCSFASSDKMLQDIFGSGRLSQLLSWTLKKQGYSIDAAEAFRKLGGRKLVVYHPSDRVIPYNASLQAAVQHDQVIRLTPKAGICESSHPDLNGKTYKQLSEKSHHNATLDWHEGAIDPMAEFLFRAPQ